MPKCLLLNASLRHVTAAVSAAACGHASLAGVISIYEGGPTVPVGQFLAPFNTAGHPPASPGVPPERVELPVQFPVISASLHPGRLPVPVQLPTAGWLAAPMFVVGDDPASRDWLTANRNRLQRAGACGLVVQVRSLDAFRSLRAIAPELPMAVGAIDELARQARILVYPFFVGVDGRISQVVP